MTAPSHFDLFVIYNIDDPASSAALLRFPTERARTQHLPVLEREHAEGGPDFQLVPTAKFVRFQPKDPFKGMPAKIKDAMAPVLARRRVPTSPWFLDPTTGQHVRRGWTPGQPVGLLKEFQAKLDEKPKTTPAPRRRRAP